VIVKELTKGFFASHKGQISSTQLETTLSDTEKKVQVPQKLDETTTLVAVKHTGVKELTYFYELDTKNYDVPIGFIVPLRKQVAPKGLCSDERCLPGRSSYCLSIQRCGWW
jgi:hypothetical protein